MEIEKEDRDRDVSCTWLLVEKRMSASLGDIELLVICDSPATIGLPLSPVYYPLTAPMVKPVTIRSRNML